MRMIKSYIILMILTGYILGQDSNIPKAKKPFMNTSDVAFLGNGNRISSILNEAKTIFIGCSNSRC